MCFMVVQCTNVQKAKTKNKPCRYFPNYKGDYSHLLYEAKAINKAIKIVIQMF